MNNEKYKNNRKVLLGPFRNKAILAVIIIFVTALMEGLSFGMLLPLLEVVINGDYGDNLISKNIAHTLTAFEDKGDVALLLSISVFVIFLAKNILVVIKNALIYRFEWSIRGWWMRNIFRMYLEMDYSLFGKIKEGESVNFVTNETLKAASALRQMLELCSQVLICSVLVLVLILSDPNITLLIIGLVGSVLYLTKKAVSRYADMVGKKRVYYDSNLSQMLVESLAGMQTVRALELSKKIFDKFEYRVSALVNVVSKSEIIKRLPLQISEVSFALMFVAIIYYIEIIIQADIVAYLPFLGMLSMVSVKLFSNIGSLSSNIMAIKMLMPSVNLIESLNKKAKEMGDVNEQKDQIQFDNMKSDLVISSLSFAYEGNAEVLKNINLSIPCNEMVGVIGESGAGKSTFVKLLLGLLVPTKGNIFVDGVDFQDIDLKSWRKKIGYVNQEPYFFNGTIKENLLMVKPQASDSELKNVLQRTHCLEFVENMPQGIDSSLGDKGLTISGGQRARLALARALLLEPNVLILDEVTGALDGETEGKIIRLIESLKGKITMVIVSHNEEVLRAADSIYSFGKNRGTQALPLDAA